MPGLGRLAYSLDGDVFIAQWDGTHPVASPTVRARMASGSRGGPEWRHLMYERWSRRGDATTGVFIADTSGRVVASFPGWPTAPDRHARPGATTIGSTSTPPTRSCQHASAARWRTRYGRRRPVPRLDGGQQLHRRQLARWPTGRSSRLGAPSERRSAARDHTGIRGSGEPSRVAGRQAVRDLLW